jgi:hypothetical protein
VSCPDWRRLDPAARDGASPQAERWAAALRHLDAGCSLCRREALAADPTLVFRRLPAPEVTPALESEEVAGARLAVAAMRAASRLEHPGREDGKPLSQWPLAVRQPARMRQASRWLLAASLTGMALLFGAGHGWRGEVARAAALLSPGRMAAAPSLHVPATGRVASDLDAPSGVLPAASRSSIEGLSRPEARVYQIDGPHMSVVMIVDAKLDV